MPACQLFAESDPVSIAYSHEPLLGDDRNEDGITSARRESLSCCSTLGTPTMSRHPEASPLVSVIVPVRDAPAELAVCLDALSAQITDFAFEVIVVDNNSTSSPAHIVARHLRARLIQEPRHAQWAARAAGLAVARGRFLAFTDADCKPSPTWLREGILPLMRSEGCGLVGGASGSRSVIPCDPRSSSAMRGQLPFARKPT